MGSLHKQLIQAVATLVSLRQKRLHGQLAPTELESLQAAEDMLAAQPGGYVNEAWLNWNESGRPSFVAAAIRLSISPEAAGQCQPGATA